MPRVARARACNAVARGAKTLRACYETPERAITL